MGWDEVLKVIPVILSSAVKFILGPSLGYAEKLNPIATILATITGMMLSVMVFTYFGEWLRTKLDRRLFQDRRIFTNRSRRFVTIWKKYGLSGVAMLTPIILTPIGGTLLAVSAGSPKEKIILFMLISATFWSVVITLSIYFFGHQILPDWVK